MSNSLRLTNNTWYEINDSETVYIFVHGFFSDSNSCWTSKCGVQWPALVLSDVRLGRPSIYMAGYPTTVDSGDAAIADCAREVFDSLRRTSATGQRAPIEKNQIVFICHSLGGIVTRYMLERYREFFTEKSIGILLIASPSYGASMANSLRGIAHVFRNKLAEQLTVGNDSLDDLDSRFKDLIVKKTLKKLVGAEAIEHHFPIHWKFIPGLRPIVSKNSASRYFGPSKLLYGTDHSTCVKPTDLTHVSHQFLVTAISDIFPEAIAHELTTSSERTSTFSGDPYSTSPALFEVYSLDNEPYYIERDTDELSGRLLGSYSLWVHGISGVGKTATIRRLTITKNLNAVHIYIGAMVSLAEGHVALLRELYYSIATRFSQSCKECTSAKQIILEIVSILHANSNGMQVVLVIDEVPVEEDHIPEIATFALALNSIIVSYGEFPGNAGIRIIVTSLLSPQAYIPQDMGRISEHIHFVEFNRWTDDEILKLIKVIAEAEKLRLQTAEEIELLLQYCHGNPRFVKTFYKNFSISQIVNVEAFESMLRQTCIQLGLPIPAKQAIK